MVNSTRKKTLFVGDGYWASNGPNNDNDEGPCGPARCKQIQAVARFIETKLFLPAKSAMINLRTSTLIYLAVSTPVLSYLSSAGPGDHLREELGVNTFTAPSVADIFKQLDSVKPLPFDQLKRDFLQTS